MVVKLPGGYHRLLLSDRGESAQPGVTPEQAFQKILDQHFDGIRLGEVVWHSKWESWIRLAHTYRDRTVFLAGDAAHVHSTAGGQGMNCCLQDAWNLGWKLAMVLQGQADEALLDTYESRAQTHCRAGDLGSLVAARDLHEPWPKHRRAHGTDGGAGLRCESGGAHFRHRVHLPRSGAINPRGSLPCRVPLRPEIAPRMHCCPTDARCMPPRAVRRHSLWVLPGRKDDAARFARGGPRARRCASGNDRPALAAVIARAVARLWRRRRRPATS